MFSHQDRSCTDACDVSAGLRAAADRVLATLATRPLSLAGRQPGGQADECTSCTSCPACRNTSADRMPKFSRLSPGRCQRAADLLGGATRYIPGGRAYRCLALPDPDLALERHYQRGPAGGNGTRAGYGSPLRTPLLGLHRGLQHPEGESISFPAWGRNVSGCLSEAARSTARACARRRYGHRVRNSGAVARGWPYSRTDWSATQNISERAVRDGYLGLRA